MTNVKSVYSFLALVADPSTEAGLARFNGLVTAGHLRGLLEANGLEEGGRPSKVVEVDLEALRASRESLVGSAEKALKVARQGHHWSFKAKAKSSRKAARRIKAGAPCFTRKVKLGFDLASLKGTQAKAFALASKVAQTTKCLVDAELSLAREIARVKTNKGGRVSTQALRVLTGKVRKGSHQLLALQVELGFVFQQVALVAKALKVSA